MRRKAEILITAFFAIAAVLAQAQDKKYTTEEYIGMYKNLAISEMERTGIPASITLAQGLLESGTGNSKLAKEARNHFGIKCKKDWTGTSLRVDDDAPNECFRVYDKAEDSYRDHSDFITTGKRYASLFELDPKDYKGWANGLKQAGYATNPNYPQLLISSIEQYKLYRLDESREVAVARMDSTHFQYNGLPAYIVKPDETIENVAKKNSLAASQLRQDNDLSDTDKVEAGTILYLKPKKRIGTQEFYTVQPGEDMYFVSQAFRIRLKQLYKKNRMIAGSEPAPGQKIYLQSKRDSSPRIIPVTTAEKKRGVIAVPKRPQVTAARHSSKENEPQNDSLVKALGLNHSKPKLPEIDTSLASRIDTTLQGLERRLKQRNLAHRLNYDSLAKASSVTLAQAPEDTMHNSGPDLLGSSHSGTYIPQHRDTIKLEDDKVKKYLEEREKLRPDSAALPSPGPDKKSTGIKQRPSQPDSAGYHRVQPGETIYSISKQYKLSPDSLKEWNKLQSNSIKQGRRLYMLPRHVSAANSHRSGQMADNNQDYHTVEKGESLYGIAKKFAINVDTLKALNKLKDNSIETGMRLKIRQY